MTRWLVISLVLFTITNAADFFYQADQHGWIVLEDGARWRLDRGEKWGTWDFIPHDPWHAVQSTANNLGWLAAVCAAVGLRTKPIWYSFVAAAILYAISRGIGFSLLLYLFTGTLT